MIHSRTAWYEFGEKSSKYFLGLEKRNKSKTHLKKLLSDDGVTELTDPKQILRCVRAWVKNLMEIGIKNLVYMVFSPLR